MKPVVWCILRGVILMYCLFHKYTRIENESLSNVASIPPEGLI